METFSACLGHSAPRPFYIHQRGAIKGGTHLIQEAYLIRLLKIRVYSSRRTLIIDTLIYTFTCTCDQRRNVFTSFLKSKKIHKNLLDRGLIYDSKKSNIVIKFSQKDAILIPLHASSDHHTCAHMRKFVASVWPSNKSEKISKK